MTIKIDNFYLVHEDGHYNLKELKDKPDKEGNDQFKVIAYGVSLERGIERIANIMVERENDRIISLDEFVAAYKSEVDRIYSILKSHE
jgi:hypothetical protein